MKSRIILTVAAAVMLLGLPLAANADVSFEHFSSVVKSMTVQLTTVDSASGKLKKQVVKYSNGVDEGDASLDNAEHFIDLDDVVVMNSSNSVDFTNLTLEMVGDLLLPTSGNSASGHAAFTLSSPSVAPANGKQLVITGSVNVKANSSSNGDKVTVVTKFQPGSVQIKTFKNVTGVTIQRATATITLPAMVKNAHPLP